MVQPSGVGSGVSNASAFQTWSPGHDDQLAGVQAVEQPVEVAETGRDAGHDAALRTDRLDLVERGLEHVGENCEVLAHPALGHVVHGLLGEVHDLVDVATLARCRPVPHLDDPGTRLNEAAQDRSLGDDAGVIGRVRGGGYGRDQRVQVARSADAGELARGRQRRRDRDRVGRLASPVQVEDSVEDGGVGRAVEVARAEDLDDVGDRVLRQQHAAEHALLRRDVLRRRAIVARVT